MPEAIALPEDPSADDESAAGGLAMALAAAGQPLQAVWRQALPNPGPGQVRLAVSACGVCRTDLHIVDGDLEFPGHPVVPGHEVVGRVAALGDGVSGLSVGQRVGVPWLGWTCGQCADCLAGRENLCAGARFTGWQLPGGFARHMLADARYVFTLPAQYCDEQAAPLLCAGLIGYRAYATARRLAGPLASRDCRRIGLYGFGAAAHLIAQVVVHQGGEVLAFTRTGDHAAQALARSLGACWAGPADRLPEPPLDAALLFAPVGDLVPQALRAVRPGGVVVCAGIHMSRIPAFDYALLWGERHIVSVANLTRADGVAFMALAATVPLAVHTTAYPLARANQALDDLRQGRLSGAAVLLP
jgi:alcohol dehydrogenase, propanol-preferring